MTDEDKAFSSIDFVGQCLVDEKRTTAFQKVINKIITKDSVVLDMGTGSGIMALSAAATGARKVYAVEFDPFVAEIPKRLIKLNNLEDKISVLINDARKIDFPEKIKFDVVISEMLTTGIVDEFQVQAINNLHDKKLVDSSTIFLPQRHDTFISLVNANFTMFGLKMPMILHLWNWHKWKNFKIKHLTNSALLNSIKFNQKNNEDFETTIIFDVKKDGIINSLYLTSRTFLTDKIHIKDTEALNAPMLIPTAERLVKRGQTLKLKINYTFGNGYKNFNALFI
jgi:predicted RNA methylase